MKIALVNDTVYPYFKGGAPKRTWEISRRLAQRGHQVHLFGMKYWDGEDVIIKDGVYLHGVCPAQELYDIKGKRSIKQAIYFAYKLLRPLLKEKFDIIDCSNFPYFPCFSAKLHSLAKGSTLLVTWLEVWGDYWYEYLGRKGILGKLVERLTSRLATATIAISEKVKRDLTLIGVDAKRIRVVPDGVNFDLIQKVKPLANRRYDVLYVGRLLAHKNVDMLIMAIGSVSQKIPDIRCGIIGDGPERESLQRLTKRLNLEGKVEFLGFLPTDEDVFSYMKSSKVFVLPSTREGAGLVTLEANACGLPVITVDTEGNAATEVIVNGDNGFLCRFSKECIAAKILLALHRKDYMARKCIEFSMRYDWNRMADLTESIYGEVAR